MPKLPISCFIIAQNEADRIARTIRSVISWMDEVIVVDSGSSDETIRVAKREGARVISQPWLGFGGQKRFAEDQCHNSWAFNIDADEVITPELKQEIIGLFKGGRPAFVAYGMPVQIVYPGDTKPRPWARDHWFVRLYDRRILHFRESAVHDSVVTDGHRVGKLRSPMHHYSMRSFAHMKAKLNERSWLCVRHANPESNAPLLPRLVTELPMNFFKYYIVRRHFMGGMTGLHYASLHAWYRFLKIYNIWRTDRFRSQDAHRLAFEASGVDLGLPVAFGMAPDTGMRASSTNSLLSFLLGRGSEISIERSKYRATAEVAIRRAETSRGVAPDGP